MSRLNVWARNDGIFWHFCLNIGFIHFGVASHLSVILKLPDVSISSFMIFFSFWCYYYHSGMQVRLNVSSFSRKINEFNAKPRHIWHRRFWQNILWIHRIPYDSKLGSAPTSSLAPNTSISQSFGWGTPGSPEKHRSESLVPVNKIYVRLISAIILGSREKWNGEEIVDGVLNEFTLANMFLTL